METKQLTTTERRVMASLGCQADLSIKELCKISGLREHQFRYALESLKERELVRTRWIIDTFKMGLLRYALYFSLTPGHKGSRLELVAQLTASPQVIIVQENGGDYDFELTALVSSTAEFIAFLNKISLSLGNILTTKSVATRLQMIQFPRKYLATLKRQSAGISIGGPGIPVELSELDLTILRALSATPDSSFREIARNIGQAESTVAARITRLRSNGVIAGCSYRTFPERYGFQIYKLLVYTRSFEAASIQQVADFSRKHPLCTAFIHSLGEWDVEIVVESSERQQVLQLRDELAVRFANFIQAIKIVPRFKSHKNVPM